MKFLWRVSIAVCELCILTVATDFSDVIEKPERVDDRLKEVEGIEDEDHEEEAPPVTYQVMDANIKVKEPASTDETLENLDKDWDKKRAIRDVAYFIRAHKFRDYDRRYYRKVSEVSRHLYQGFPKPALRSLHWEVHKFCVSGFDACLNYVERTVKLTSLRREDDTVTVMRENSWNLENNTEEILATQKDCEMAKRRDNRSALPFAGPIERFQWRTTVSYYMCWYTMLGIPELALFGEPCDNHANCLDQYGNNNRDPRADDTTPYACALYSFCPDHCCPIKHIWYMKDCFQSQENPCHYGKRGDAYEAPELSPEGRCSLLREDNKDFSSLVADRINVTCECQHAGYEWSSRFGLCVDVNECAQSQHNCSEEEGETCFNLPGRFACVCRLGYVYNDEKKSCVKSPSLEKTLRDLVIDRNDTESKSLFALIIEKDEPNAISRVKAFEGNLLYNGLGLAKAERTALANVTVVLHAAGPHDAVFEFAQELPAVSVVGAASSIFRHKGQITESLQNEYIPEIPLCLIRVPLLGPAWKEPMPGHVEILRGATALMVGAGYALCRSELPAELIPIDLAVNTMLAAVHQRETREHKDSSTTVYNATTIGCTWGELINKAQRANRNFAYPSFGIPGMTSLVFLHRIVVFLLEWLPSVICDTILSLFGGKNRILEEHLRIRNALQSLEPILLRSWPVERNRIHLLQRQLSLEEQEAFPVYVDIDVETYVLCAAAATRKHCSDDRNSRIIKNFKWFSLAFLIFAIFLLLCK